MKKEPSAKAEPRRFPRDVVIKSKELKRFGLSKDVLRAVLDDGFYSVEDAVRDVEKYVQGFNQ